MPWSNVNSSALAALLDDVAACFTNGDLEHYPTTGEKLRALLTAQHTDNDMLPRRLFKLAIWRSNRTASIELALGFYKTIKRTPPFSTSSQGGRPTHRFWGVTMGHNTTMDSQKAYDLVKDRCQSFYDNERDDDPTTGQKCRLVIIDQASRPLQPDVYFADAVAQKLMDDNNFKKTDLGNFPRYASFKHDVHLWQIDPK
jgi:hypothetical protein